MDNPAHPNYLANTEFALSAPEYQVISAINTERLRILAILGNSEGIDVNADRKSLEELATPYAEIVFHSEPQRSDINNYLRNEEWTILFFSGHSSSQNNEGRIFINQNDSLTIEDLKYELRNATQRGLQLAIFNSCDGLKLAENLAELHIPQTIVMREPVPDKVAQAFLKHFLQEFSKGETLYLSVKRAREWLHSDGWNEKIPGCTWLPVIWQNPAVPPMSLLELGHSGKNLSNRLKRTQTQPEVHLTPRELRNRRDLLSQVKDEVNSRLKQSLHNANFINLDKESQPQQVKPRLWDVEVKVVSQPNQPYFLSANEEIIDIFDDESIAGKLLILGEPGSGKTTTLLELAKELVNRAENSPAEPLPFLFNLSSWKGDKSIDQWFIEELKSKYGVHKKIGKEWVESGQLLPLLDGLDELDSSRQEPMIKEINQFLASDKRPLYLVVCSRREEYELQKVQLQLNAAICLQPLTDIQIRIYLRAAECLALWESFQNDTALYELAKSPFFLSVIVLSASEISHENWVKLNSSAERQQYLFEMYTKKMLSRNLKKRYYFRWLEPSMEKTQHWLEELAIRLEGEKESEFLVEKLQSDEPSYRALFAISSVLIAVLVSLVTSFNQ